MKNPGPSEAVSIADVGRATSAAPFYFAPVKLGDLIVYDGSLGANNPSLEAVREVKLMNEQRRTYARANGPPEDLEKDRAIDLLVAIGTGRRSYGGRLDRGNFYKRISSLANILTDTEIVHEQILYMAIPAYHRYQPSEVLGVMPFDEWIPRRARWRGRMIESGSSTLERITKLTSEYLSDADTISRLRESARILVQLRRSRPSLKSKPGSEPKLSDLESFASFASNPSSSPPSKPSKTNRSETRKSANISIPNSSADLD